MKKDDLIFDFIKDKYVSLSQFENSKNWKNGQFNFDENENVFQFNGKPFFDYLKKSKNLNNQDLPKLISLISQYHDPIYFKGIQLNDYDIENYRYILKYCCTATINRCGAFIKSTPVCVDKAIENDLDFRLNSIIISKNNLKELKLAHDIYQIVNPDKAHIVRKMLISLL